MEEEHFAVQVPPVRLWGLDPLHRCNIKLFISQIHLLKQVPDFKGVYFLHGHPVTRFEVVGCIVSVDRKERFIKYAVDDGTGVIFCTIWLNNNTQEKDTEEKVELHKLGELVSVAGKLHVFREERELNVDRITVETDPNFEAFHWIEVMKCHDIYTQQVILPPEFSNT